MLFKWLYRAKSRLPISATPADPVFSTTHRMCQDGALRLSLICPLCLWHCVRTPVIGPFSVDALQTGVVKLQPGHLHKVHCTIFGTQMTVTAASIACSLQDFKWAKNENLVFSRALVKPPKC